MYCPNTGWKSAVSYQEWYYGKKLCFYEETLRVCSLRQIME